MALNDPFGHLGKGYRFPSTLTAVKTANIDLTYIMLQPGVPEEWKGRIYGRKPNSLRGVFFLPKDCPVFCLFSSLHF